MIVRENHSRLRRALSKTTLIIAALAVSTGMMTSATSWASGVSVASETQSVASESYSYPLQFDASVNTSVETLAATPDNTAVSSTFYQSYVTATQTYGTALISAAQIYSDDYQTNPAEAKDAYVDSFNHAADTYFNTLESARNTVVSELSGKDDVAKDMFVNEYNTARDTYRNQIESIKNQIVSL